MAELIFKDGMTRNDRDDIERIAALLDSFMTGCSEAGVNPLSILYVLCMAQVHVIANTDITVSGQHAGCTLHDLKKLTIEQFEAIFKDTIKVS